MKRAVRRPIERVISVELPLAATAFADSPDPGQVAELRHEADEALMMTTTDQRSMAISQRKRTIANLESRASVGLGICCMGA